MEDTHKLNLIQTSTRIKSAVIDLTTKINQQELIIESINDNTNKHASSMVHNMNKFGSIVEMMKKDPRNKIIMVLFLISMFLLYYLMK